MKLVLAIGMFLFAVVGADANAEELSTAKKIEYKNKLAEENAPSIAGKQSGGTGIADMQLMCKDTTLNIPVNFTSDFVTKWEKENFNGSCLCGGVRYAIAKICENAKKSDLAEWVKTIKAKVKKIECTYAGGQGDTSKNKANVTLKNGVLSVAIDHHISQNCKSAGVFAESVLEKSL